ncbi:hypothetical protein NY2A_b807R [Paramecium bursaria Chlorella virus NY2A]|uniref:Uncharacterized protein b807R n=1 Tax=Paramecium bursaria Chlorella virus NY2A TaxID=46021 RepID=A7IXY2_PBCVN|nr:hypothetical protein NY2A_b807R [Paramecium bursaria Chlorella virus NY2A]ABT15206.1 hypothetical protein NY2A_b807R [Paramecium bursaria Chlorella virus NY2A]
MKITKIKYVNIEKITKIKYSNINVNITKITERKYNNIERQFTGSLCKYKLAPGNVVCYSISWRTMSAI